MKRVGILAVMVLALATTSAYAISFTNVYDPPDILIGGNPDTITFTHDLTIFPGSSTSDTTGQTSPAAFVPGLFTVTSASIAIRFVDDDDTPDNEKVDISFESVLTANNVLITSGAGTSTTFNSAVSTGSVSSDGKLVVTLARDAGDFRFAHSTLTMDATAINNIAVPEPMSLVLVSSGLVLIARHSARRPRRGSRVGGVR